MLIASGDIDARERLGEDFPTVGAGRDRLCRRGLAAFIPMAAGWNVSSRRARSRRVPTKPPSGRSPVFPPGWHSCQYVRTNAATDGVRLGGDMYQRILVPIDLADPVRQAGGGNRRDDGAHCLRRRKADQRGAADAGDAGGVRATGFRNAAAQGRRGGADARGRGNRSRRRTRLDDRAPGQHLSGNPRRSCRDEGRPHRHELAPTATTGAAPTCSGSSAGHVVRYAQCSVRVVRQ